MLVKYPLFILFDLYLTCFYLFKLIINRTFLSPSHTNFITYQLIFPSPSRLNLGEKLWFSWAKSLSNRNHNRNSKIFPLIFTHSCLIVYFAKWQIVTLKTELLEVCLNLSNCQLSKLSKADLRSVKYTYQRAHLFEKCQQVHHFITTNPHHDAVFRLFTKIFTSIIIHVRTVLSLHCYTKQMKQKMISLPKRIESLAHTHTLHIHQNTLQYIQW